MSSSFRRWSYLDCDALLFRAAMFLEEAPGEVLSCKQEEGRRSLSEPKGSSR